MYLLVKIRLKKKEKKLKLQTFKDFKAIINGNTILDIW